MSGDRTILQSHPPVVPGATAARGMRPGAAEFTEHPKVADAASELLRDVFGEETVSSRLVFGVASLPLGSPVALEVILEITGA